MSAVRGWRRNSTSVFLIGAVALAALFSSYQYLLDVKAYYSPADPPTAHTLETANQKPSSSQQSGHSSRPTTTPQRIHNATPAATKIPPPFDVKHPARRYPSKSPFLHSEGYQPTGGTLPLDPADYLEDPHMWRFVDNTTCINKTAITSDSVPAQWQYRAPYAILLGAMKAGTHAVIESLWDHPLVVPTGHWELHFYDSPKAIRNEKGIQRDTTLRNYAQAVKRAMGSNVSLDSSFVWGTTNHSSSSSSSNHDEGRIPMVMVESSPKYIVNSDRIPEMIMCVSPWVKLMAILRNPVARVESHYRFLDESKRANTLPMVDWQVWIEDDLRLLQKAGVLNATTPEEEYLAWKFYQRRPHSQQIVGRGLYVIPLEHYLRAMERVGKPRSDLYVMQSEQFRLHRQGEYDKLLQFMGLPHHQLSNASEQIHKTLDGAMPMPDHIRQRLETLYRPYNARLYDLLGWSHVWD
jgi:hypothetical protein